MNKQDKHSQIINTKLQNQSPEVEAKLEWLQPELLSITMRDTKSGTTSIGPGEGSFYSAS